MNSIEQQIAGLEAEDLALKRAFRQAGKNLAIYSYAKDVTFPTNQVTEKTSTGAEYKYNGTARITVTFATSTGANTIAKIETTGVLSVRRAEYQGGARWILTAASGVDRTIAVHSIVPGELSYE